MAAETNNVELKPAPVACLCCRKSRASLMVTDNGYRTYPVCKSCRGEMIDRLVVNCEPIAK